VLLDQADFLHERIEELTTLIDAQLAAMPAAWGVDAGGATGPHAGTGPDPVILPAALRLAEIPGISPALAAAIIGEIGLDMSRFPTAGHLVSWTGLCPRTVQSGARKKDGSKPGNAHLRGLMGQAANGAARTGTATCAGERHQRIARRRGKAKAQVATGRFLLLIIWHLLANPEARYTDLGPGWYDRHVDAQRQTRNHVRQLEALGYTVTITPAAA
jgi:transposase